MVARKAKPSTPEPDGFRPSRSLGAGRYPLLKVFPGLDRLPAALRLAPDATERARLFGDTEVELVDEDMWMYVAPHEMPKVTRARGWKPVVSPECDCIVVGVGHLRDSPLLVLFMDIYHELGHVIQRQGGANLWEPGVSYVERWTEVEAYRFVVTEARALGATDAFLRDYLKVEWISDKEHAQLLKAVGVPVA